jgi:hypothetical protein
MILALAVGSVSMMLAVIAFVWVCIFDIANLHKSQHTMFAYAAIELYIQIEDYLYQFSTQRLCVLPEWQWCGHAINSQSLKRHYMEIGLLIKLPMYIHACCVVVNGVGCA